MIGGRGVESKKVMGREDSTKLVMLDGVQARQNIAELIMRGIYLGDQRIVILSIMGNVFEERINRGKEVGDVFRSLTKTFRDPVSRSATVLLSSRVNVLGKRKQQRLVVCPCHAQETLLRKQLRMRSGEYAEAFC